MALAAVNLPAVPQPVPGRLWRELVLGPAYWWHKRLIRRSRTWDETKRLAYQRRRAARRFQLYGADIRDKDHYRRSQKVYNFFCIKGLTKVVRTGGTTAAPFAFHIDTLFRRQKERAYLFDAWSRIGYAPFDLRVVFRGNVEDALLSYHVLENCYVISPNRLTTENAGAVAEFLRRLPAFFLHVYPSSLAGLVDLLGESEMRRLPVRGVLAGSESFPPRQMRGFERRFGWKIAHWYGHAEYVSLAYRCELCGGFHFYPTYGFTELIERIDQSARIVATSFNLIGTRFVRYNTGDLARVSTRSCTDPFLRVDAIEGRQQEFFVDAQGVRRAFGPLLFGIHDEFWERIRAIQFVQRRAGELIVRAVLRSDAERGWLESYLRARFAVCSLRFEYPGTISKTLAGKHKYFVDDVGASEGGSGDTAG